MKKLLSAFLSIVLVSLCFIPNIFAEETEGDSVDSGYVNVVAFGAVGTDKNDDSAAFEAALATGKNIYVPKGKFYISKTIVLSDRILRGASPNQANIIGAMEDKNSPIVLLEGCSSIYDVVVTYPTKEECVGAKQGEKVAIQAGSAKKPLEPGSVVKSVYLLNNGTSVYSPADAGCNGVMFENVEIKHFTYRGFDMQSENRMLNSYSNCYITS